MKSRTICILRLAAWMTLAAWISWQCAWSSAHPAPLIHGDNNVVIVITEWHARHQFPSAVSASFNDCASAEPTRRKAFCPESSASR